MNLGGTVIIARDEAVQDFREKQALLRAEPAHDAEIDGDEPAVIVDEQISRMHVGVKEAVAQRVAEKRLDQRARQASAGRSLWPASRARSDSGVASIHSSVSTSLLVRSQSTVGTRKSGSSLVFSAISESAAASRRKSISTVTVRRKVSTTSMSRSRRASAEKIFGVARDEGEGARDRRESDVRCRAAAP